MHGVAEAVRSLGAICALVSRDERALVGFDGDVLAWRRSHAALLITLPLHMIIAAGAFVVWRDLVAPAAPSFGQSTFTFAVAAMMVAGWFGYPLLVRVLTEASGTTERLRAYLTAYNWSVPVVAAFVAIPMGLLAAGLISTSLAAAAAGASWAIGLMFRHFLAVRMLSLEGATAAVLVAFDLALTGLLVEMSMLAAAAIG